MRLHEFEPRDQIVYIVRLTAHGLVRRACNGRRTPIVVTILGRRCDDATYIENAGGNDRYAAIEITCSAITWGNGGTVGRDQTLDRILDATIWVQSGDKVDGPMIDPTIKVHCVTQVDPRSGDTVVDELDRN